MKREEKAEDKILCLFLLCGRYISNLQPKNDPNVLSEPESDESCQFPASLQEDCNM